MCAEDLVPVANLRVSLWNHTARIGRVRDAAQYPGRVHLHPRTLRGPTHAATRLTTTHRRAGERVRRGDVQGACAGDAACLHRTGTGLQRCTHAATGLPTSTPEHAHTTQCQRSRARRFGRSLELVNAGSQVRRRKRSKFKSAGKAVLASKRARPDCLDTITTPTVKHAGAV